MKGFYFFIRDVVKMTEPFIFLCSEISGDDELYLVRWLQDEEVCKYLSDARDVSAAIGQITSRAGSHVLQCLFNRDGRFYMVYGKRKEPVGFVRLVVNNASTEIVIVIGDRKNWGKRYGTKTIRECMKIAFFELRSAKMVANIHRENKRSIGAFANAGFRMERETAKTLCFAITMDEYIKLIKGGFLVSGGIMITKIDKERLTKLISERLYSGRNTDKSLNDLENEINKATVVDPEHLPPDVISMNTKALLDLNGDELQVSLVYPEDADWSKGMLSVLSPVGVAILGYREGKTIKWEVPSGITEIRIKKVLYQPEAVGDYHL
jgi:regulator of nucleoside diphosphate kinase